MSPNIGPFVPRGGILGGGFLTQNPFLGADSVVTPITSRIVSEATDYLRAFIKQIPVTSIQVIAADNVKSEIWKLCPWRWATVGMDPITLVDGQQDYDFAPSDYLRLVRARIVRTDSPLMAPEITAEPEVLVIWNGSPVR